MIVSATSVILLFTLLLFLPFVIDLSSYPQSAIFKHEAFSSSFKRQRNSLTTNSTSLCHRIQGISTEYREACEPRHVRCAQQNRLEDVPDSLNLTGTSYGGGSSFIINARRGFKEATRKTEIRVRTITRVKSGLSRNWSRTVNTAEMILWF